MIRVKTEVLMKKNIVIGWICLVIGFWGTGNLQGMDKGERDAVVAAAMDYMEGAHTGDVARIERSVHPELTKVSIRKVRETGEPFLYKAGFTRLRELVRANLVPLEKEKLSQLKVKVFAIKEGLAAAVAISPQFYDYQLLAKIEGKWQLINVLWTSNSPSKKEVPITAEDKNAIKTACMDYIDGYFSRDVARMERGIHPELTKVIPAVLPKTGKTMLNKTTASLLIAYTKVKSGLLPKEKRKINVKILDIKENIAMAEVISSLFYDYLQLAKINNQWKIVNVLWKMNPKAPKRKKS